MIAHIFLGRRVVITRKMVWLSLGVFGMHILGQFVLPRLAPVLVPDMGEMIEKIGIGGFIEETQYVLLILSYIMWIAIFIYSFAFFAFAYQEKKLIRALASLGWMFLLQQYQYNICIYLYSYVTSASAKKYADIVSWNLYSAYESIFIIAGMNLAFSLLSAAWLYFFCFKEKNVYVISTRSRILIIVWMILFYMIPQIPLSEVEYTFDRQYQLVSPLFGIGVFMMGMIVPVCLVLVVSKKRLKEQNRFQEQYLKAELEYIEQYKAAQTQTRAFRHDIINNLSLTGMLLDEGKGEEAREHIRELIGDVREFSQQYATGDEMLDCIVSMKAEKMKDMQIAFSSEGVVENGLQLKPMDICSIFANAFDNAIEASRQTSEPKVALKIKHTGKFMLIEIENSVNEKVNVDRLLSGEGYTSKKDRTSHGFGFGNIRRTVENNEGVLKAKCDEGLFVLSIMLPKTAA